MIEAGLHVDMETKLHGADMAVRSVHEANMFKNKLTRESILHWWEHPPAALT